MKIITKITLFFLLGALIFFDSAFSSNSKDIAIILKSKGQVKVRAGNSGKWRYAKQGMRINSGDIIKTGDNALAALMFTDDKSLVKIRENSSIAIKGKRKKTSLAKKLRFAFGQIWVKVKKQKTEFHVETPSGTAVVKGTEFYHFVDRDGNSIIIGIEGLVSLKNKYGEVLIKSGETGKSSKGTAPTSGKTEGSDVPNWGQEDGIENFLEFEFEDSDGNKKVLKIKYQDN